MVDALIPPRVAQQNADTLRNGRPRRAAPYSDFFQVQKPIPEVDHPFETWRVDMSEAAYTCWELSVDE
jgi:hypothetical protein